MTIGRCPPLYVRSMKKICAVLVLVLTAAVLRAEDSLADRLQKALFEEEANHNLDAAIEQYQSIVSLTAEQRKIAATALYRLAQCYRKLGREEESRKMLAQLAREFPEQGQFAERAATNSASRFEQRLQALVSKSNETRDRFAELARLFENSPDLVNASATNNKTYLQ